MSIRTIVVRGRTRWLCKLLAILLLAGCARPAGASPEAGRVSLIALPVPPLGAFFGAELEARLGPTPLIVGGQGVYVSGGTHAQGTVWLGYRQELPGGYNFGALAGVNQTWDRRATPGVVGAVPGPNLYPGPIGYVVGLSASKSWGSLWVRANPNYVLIPGFMSYLTLREAMISGIPWLEVGYRVAPWAEISLRASMPPLAVTLIL